LRDARVVRPRREHWEEFTQKKRGPRDALREAVERKTKRRRRTRDYRRGGNCPGFKRGSRTNRSTKSEISEPTLDRFGAGES